MTFYVYLVECSDNTYYCGYTKDLEKRLAEHNNSDKGAKYTKGRRPVRLVYSEKFADLSSALKREHSIKKLTRNQKKNLVSNR